MHEGELQVPADRWSTDADRHHERERIIFPGNEKPTIGVELEVSLVDLETRQLAPRAPEILAALGDDVHTKPELFQTIVELNTDVCNAVSEVRTDLQGRIHKLNDTCEKLGVGVISVGTHPTADWRHLPITDGERYNRLVESMQWPARRLLICGMHVHVGVRTGEHAVALMNSLSVFIPHMLALSASSPYWLGQDTGMASSRIKIFEGLPTAGLPPFITNWSEFVELMRTLQTARAINSIREIWWDIRPHTGFGTLEIRVCDGINTLSEVCALTALIQCLVSYLQAEYDSGEPLPWLRGWTIKENKWRASRFAERAKIIRNERGDILEIDDHIREWVELLAPTAEALKCVDELNYVTKILDHGPSYQRQRNLMKALGSNEALIDALMAELRDDEPWTG